MTPAGFPHSEISGSQVVCTSPKLIAAYHVLHRLLTPRHPPDALSSLTEQRCSIARLAQDHEGPGRYRHLAMQLSKISRCRTHVTPAAARPWAADTSGTPVPTRVKKSPGGLRHPGYLHHLSSATVPFPNARIRQFHVQRLVEITGIEPVTSGLQSRRSPN